jgi:hypothetical protein
VFNNYSGKYSNSSKNNSSSISPNKRFKGSITMTSKNNLIKMSPRANSNGLRNNFHTSSTVKNSGSSSNMININSHIASVNISGGVGSRKSQPNVNVHINSHYGVTNLNKKNINIESQNLGSTKITRSEVKPKSTFSKIINYNNK